MKENLSITHPQVAVQWHPTLNGDLRPENVTFGSGKTIWWLGECGHEWPAKICVRTGQNQGCSVCAGKRVVKGINDLATTAHTIAKQWHPTLNEDLTPFIVTAGSDKKAWWLGECGHEWKATIKDRVAKNAGCPVCLGRLIIPGINDLSTTHPVLAIYWHPTKNNKLDIKKIVAGTKTKVAWICPEGHEWKAPVCDQTVKEGEYCSSCVGRKVVPGFNDLKTTHPEIAAEWHPTLNKELLPEQFTFESHSIVWWFNKDCGHSWNGSIRNRCKGTASCQYCSNKKFLSGHNDLATYNPAIALQWDYVKNANLNSDPKNIIFSSDLRVWWKCEKGHSWKAVIKLRARNSYGCPACAAANYVSKNEQAIADFVRSLGFAVEQSNRKILGRGEIDIFIPAKNLAIEFNGIYWHTEEAGKGKGYHYDKWVKCRDVGIQLIQIWEDEWRENPALVKSMLSHKLGVADTSNRVAARQTSVVSVDPVQARDFLTKNHIQGFAAGSYYFGLADKEGHLLSVLVLKDEAGKCLNVVRYATSATVVGGFTKLLKYVERNLDVSSFVTFSDNCVSDGALYANTGFIADKELPPDYKYVLGVKRHHKFNFRLQRFKTDPSLTWEEGLTERELAQLNRIARIWDAGKTRWVKSV